MLTIILWILAGAVLLLLGISFVILGVRELEHAYIRRAARNGRSVPRQYIAPMIKNNVNAP